MLRKDKNSESIPSNYFDQFKEKLMTEIKEEEIFDWNDFPILKKLDQEDGFELPGQYFENFSPSQGVRRLNGRSLVQNWMKVAAVGMLVLAFLGFGIFSKQIDTSAESLSSLEVNDSEYDALIDELYEMDITEEDLVEMYDESDLEFSENSDEELLSYLEDELDVYDMELILNF